MIHCFHLFEDFRVLVGRADVWNTEYWGVPVWMQDQGFSELEVRTRCRVELELIFLGLVPFW